MRIAQFNGYMQQSNAKKQNPSFEMKLDVKENAMKYFEKKIGDKFLAHKKVDMLKSMFEARTVGKNANAVIDIEESSMGIPELIINGLKGKKYPVNVTASDLAENTYATKHLLNGGYRISAENGKGYRNENPFTDSFKAAIAEGF